MPWATGLAVLAALPYVILEPASADLAAQTFRADLWSEHGWVLWNGAWYGGHLLPGYSLLYPPLASLVGIRITGVLGAVLAAAAFASIVERSHGERAWLASYWFALATATMLYTGRLTFALGTGLGLAAIWAAQRERRPLAALLAVLAVAASPVAGLFVALAGAAAVLAGHRRAGLPLVVGGGVALAAMVVAFPTDGYHPLFFRTYLSVPTFAVLALVLVPRRERLLRTGVVLYLLLVTAAFLVHTPLGGNSLRLGSLAAGPFAALALYGRRNLALALVALPLVFWQWTAPVHDLAAAVGDPSTQAGYYRPLLDALDRESGGGVVSVEVPPTRNRWESVYVAPRYPLARGWLRQLESEDSPLFLDASLDASSYQAWLREHGVSFVALDDAEPDYLAQNEDALLQGGLPYLDLVFADDHWQLWRLRDAGGLAGGGAQVTELGPDGFTASVPGAGEFAVHLRWTSYFRVASGPAGTCVQRDGEWTRLVVPAGEARVGAQPATVRVEARLSLGGLTGRDEDCLG